MTEPLSPLEIARRRTASYFVAPAEAGEDMRRLLDIAKDHARLVEAQQLAIDVADGRADVDMGDLGREGLLVRQIAKAKHTLRAENAKLRERAVKLEAVVSVARERKRACDCLPESGCVAARFEAALVVLDEEDGT